MPDTTDFAILHELQANARISTAELGRRVSLSSPAVAERVRRLEESGVIEGYSARVNLRALGYALQAIVTLAIHDGSTATVERIRATLNAMAEVIAAFWVTGPDCVVLRIAVRDVDHLQDVINRLNVHGRTATSVVLSTVVQDRPVLPRGEGS
jgi:Lrp/AsnC family leucine-responsive transcriptional regulator